jgi:hypothetical protein
MGWMTEESWFDSRQRYEGPWPVLVYKPDSCSMGTEFSSQSSKLLKLEGGHLSLHIAGFKNAWCCTPNPPYAFIGWCLIKNKGNFTTKISTENMVNNRNCETGTTLATLILYTEIICGIGPWSNMQICWCSVYVECKIATWRPGENYFSIRFDGDKKHLVLHNLNIIWGQMLNMHNDIIFVFLS